MSKFNRALLPHVIWFVRLAIPLAAHHLHLAIGLLERYDTVNEKHQSGKSFIELY